MKKYILTAIGAAIVAFAAIAGTPSLRIVDTDGNSVLVPYADITSLTLSNDNTVVGTSYNTYTRADATVKYMTSADVANVMMVDIVWNADGTVTYENPLAHRGVTVSVSGGYVTVDNTNTTDEITVRLTGTTTDGGYTYNGSYKTTLQLNGVSITSKQGAAIDIECGKRIAVVLNSGTVNTLVDYSGGKQKAAMYFKGHPEFEGAGTLNVTGTCKHAISAKEYIQLKKTVGTVNILGSANDGIHAAQYFQMNGGSVNISNVAGDGIQAEITDDATDEDNGQMIIKGGSLTINCSAEDVACLKADSLITVSGGTISLTATGAASKGIKGKGDLKVTDGDFTFVNSGNVIIEDGDPSYSTAVKINGDATISGGTFTVTNSGQGGKGFSVDGTFNITGGTFNITTSGDGALYDPTSTGSSESYKVYVSVPSSGGMGPNQQGGVWSTVYVYAEDGTLQGTCPGSVSVSVNGRSTTFYYYDFKKATEGTFYFGAPDYTSGGGFGGSSGTTYTIKSGNFSGPTDGSNHFYTISSSYSTSGTVRTYSISDVTSTYQSGTIKSDGNESYSAAGFKCDGNVTITGGNITITSTGKGGKGINIDGVLTIGTEGATDGPSVSASTTGAAISTSGSGMNSSLTGQPKAIKALGDIYINSGTIVTSTKNDGGEGIESKASITFNGGTTVCTTYDDGINAATKITFNGGVVWANASGNDGIDCNGSQGFEFNGGIVISQGTSSPEEGFDCDNNTFKINGGTLMGIGGSTSTPTSATQPYKSQSGQSLTANTYLTLQKSDGTVIVAYKVPRAISSATVLVSSPEFVSGTSYKLVRNCTAVSNPTESYFDGVITLGGTATGGTSTSITPTTK